MRRRLVAGALLGGLLLVVVWSSAGPGGAGGKSRPPAAPAALGRPPGEGGRPALARPARRSPLMAGGSVVPGRRRMLAAAHRPPSTATPAGSAPVFAWWSTPVSAVSAFARVYTNWSATSVSRRLRLLAAASLGPARREMAAQAIQTQNDPELQSGGLSNQGVLEAVTPLPGQPDRYIVITRERTVAAAGSDLAGLPASWHVTLAAVTQLGPGRWVVSDWRPES